LIGPPIRHLGPRFNFEEDHSRNIGENYKTFMVNNVENSAELILGQVV